MVCALAVGCGDDSENLAPFVGAFRYTEGEMSASCSGVRNSVPISGIEVDIAQRSADELEYTAGPRCSVRFRVRGSKASVLPGQSCEMAVEQTSARGDFSFGELVVVSGGLTHFATGTAEALVPQQPEAFACERFQISGTLTRQ